MGRGDVSLACASALVDALVAGGVRHACVSPGSRSTPLALALARNERVTVHVHLDERSGAFFALGLAKATQRPVAVACTSGTAAAECFPAVVEASQSRVPLVVLTADRPLRLRGTGANQTIDQTELYGRYARAYVEPPVPTTSDDVAAWLDAGLRVLRAASGLPIGPVHVNCCFEEPLVPEGAGPVSRVTIETERRPKPWEGLAGPEDVDRVAEAISGARGVIVAGPRTWEDSDGIGDLADHLGWPLLAEPASGVRLPEAALAAGQALLGDDAWIDAHRSEVVLQLGAAPTTRATQRLVASAGRLVVIDIHHLEPDPEGRADVRIHAQPKDVIGPLLGRPFADDGEPIAFALTEGDPLPDVAALERLRIAPAPFGWLAGWQGADDRARRAIDAKLDDEGAPSELRVARDVAAFVPDGGFLFVGSSTPIRDLDLAMAPRDGLRVLTNRGASGIDGSIATALGAAAAGRGPLFALLGDLTFLYDVGTLAWQARRGLHAVLVVLNNGGGEIFSQLPQRGLPEHRDLFTTPHGFADFSALCAGLGVRHATVSRSAELGPALERAVHDGGIHVVEVRIDPERDRACRDELRAAVHDVLAAR